MVKATFAILCLLLASACGSGAGDIAGPRRTPSPGKTPVPTAMPGEGGDSTTDGGEGGGGQVQPPDARPSGSGSEPRDPGAGAPAAATAGNDGGAIGDNAVTYLRGDVPRLVIEVDAVAGKQPVKSTLDHLQASLAEVLTKPGGIAFQNHETFGPPDSSYTDEEIRALERSHRQTHTSAEAASLYILFLNGSYEKDDSVLGVTFSASAFAIFSDAVASASTPLVSRHDIEKSVTLHEAGHLLRLVNIGYTSPRDHEDPRNKHHSRNRESVMYWAVESNLVSSVLNGPPPDAFDGDDKADLADLKSGRL